MHHQNQTEMKQLKTIPAEYKLLFALMVLMALRLIMIITNVSQYFIHTVLS